MRLIDADALLEKLRKTDRYFMVKFDIESEPTVELRSKDERRFKRMNCNYCSCISCALYEDCQPCLGDYDYEHPCQGICDDYEKGEEE